MEFWIARDKAGTLTVFSTKPEYMYDRYWQNDKRDGKKLPIVISQKWLKTMFNFVTFENSPQRIVLKITDGEEKII